jgi:hypothetical protein
MCLSPMTAARAKPVRRMSPRGYFMLLLIHLFVALEYFGYELALPIPGDLQAFSILPAGVSRLRW